MTRIGSYDEDEVRVLVEEYEELMDSRSRAYVHVRLMDLDQAIEKLPLKLHQAIYLHGQIGMSVRVSAHLLGIPPTTLYTRYTNGLGDILKSLNGGTREIKGRVLANRPGYRERSEHDKQGSRKDVRRV